MAFYFYFYSVLETELKEAVMTWTQLDINSTRRSRQLVTGASNPSECIGHPLTKLTYLNLILKICHDVGPALSVLEFFNCVLEATVAHVDPPLSCPTLELPRVHITG